MATRYLGGLLPPRFGWDLAWMVPGLVLFVGIAAGAAFISGFLIVGGTKMLLFWMVIWGGLFEALLIIPMPQAGCYRLFVLIPFAEWVSKQIPGAGATSAEDYIIFLHMTSVMLRVRKWPLPKAVNIPLVLFMLYAAIESFNPYIPQPLVVYYGIRQDILPLMMFWVGYYVFEEERQMKRLLWWLATIAVLTCLYAWKQEFVGLDPMELRYAGVDAGALVKGGFWIHGVLRVFGPFPSPWEYAEFLVTMTLLTLALVFGSDTLRAKFVGLIFIGIFLFTLVLTQVHSSYFGLMLAMIVVVFARLPGRLRWGWATLVFAGGVAFVMVGYDLALPINPGTSQLAQAYVGLDPLADKDLMLRAQSWEMFTRPISIAPFGYGIGMTTSFAKSAGYVSHVTDNQFVSLLAELGWFSVPIFLWFTAGCFIVAIRAARLSHSKFAHWFIPAMIGAHASIFFHYTTTPLLGSPGTTYFWFLFGAACAFPFIRRADVRRAVPSVLLPALSPRLALPPAS